MKTSAAENDEQGVRAAIRTFETGWNRHDMDIMFQAFTPDAEWVNVVGMWWRGLADVKRAHRAYHDTFFANTPFTIDEIQMRFVTQDTAIAVVKWSKGSFLQPNGHPTPAGRDMMSVVLVKQAGRWLITSGHNTSVDERALPFDPIK